MGWARRPAAQSRGSARFDMLSSSLIRRLSFLPAVAALAIAARAAAAVV